MYDITERVKEVWKFYNELLDRKIDHISELSGVSKDKIMKINPAEFIEKNKGLYISNYKYQKIAEWLKLNKKDDNYLVSPLDADIETANQIAYKERIDNLRIRGGKCKVIPIPSKVALRFFVKNHRQSVPNIRTTAISFGLIYHGKLVGVMTYDLTDGGIRGKTKSNKYELLRLAFAHGYSIMGGAGKLQKHCESALLAIGCNDIFSYSNATINNGKVYEALGFSGTSICEGQPFVIMENNKIERLITLFPNSTDKKLAEKGRIKTHIGGNKLWEKTLKKDESWK